MGARRRLARSVVRILCISIALLATPASASAIQATPDVPTAPDLLRALYERQSETLAAIQNLTITQEGTSALALETTLYAERIGGPTGSELVPRFSKDQMLGWNPVRDGADLRDSFLWLLPAGLDDAFMAAASDLGSSEVAGRRVRVLEPPEWEPFLLSGGLLDMLYYGTSSIRLFIDPERLLLLRMELIGDPAAPAELAFDTIGITFEEYQEVEGFIHPRAQVFDFDESMGPYADWDREMLEDYLVSLREQVAARSREGGPPAGGIPGIEAALDPQRKIESIERYLRGEPDVVYITDVKVDAGPPPSLGAAAHPDEPAAAPIRVGEFPAGAVSVDEVAGVRGELYFTVFAPPELIRARVPAEYVLLTARDVAASDSALSAYLQENPLYNDWVLTAFNVSAVDSLTEGASGVPHPEVLANWQAPVAFFGRLPEPLPDEVPVVYDLGTWTDTSSDSVDISLTQDRSGRWNLDLRTPALRISGSCAPHGNVIPASYEAPTYLVMFGPATPGEELTVLKSSGHEGQTCQGSWTVSGSHPLAEALSGRPSVPSTWAQDMIVRGWRARIARYDRW